jgi:hypothetical protein
MIPAETLIEALSVMKTMASGGTIKRAEPYEQKIKPNKTNGAKTLDDARKLVKEKTTDEPKPKTRRKPAKPKRDEDDDLFKVIE